MNKFIILLLIQLRLVPARLELQQDENLGYPQKGSLVERLGYPPNAKLLIIHADDIGLAHSVNKATIESMESGFVTSASIMVPCPWFPEIADYAARNPEADFGIHLTVTGEWELLRWGSVLPQERAPSLVDEFGYMYKTAQEVADLVDLQEIEAELHEQIDRAIRFGVSPSHFDPHMGTMRQTLELFEVYLRLGRFYRVPVKTARNQVTPEQLELMTPDDVLIDYTFDIQPQVTDEEWAEWYFDSFRGLPDGTVSVVNIHVGYDNPELQAVSINHPEWGSAWRQRDFDTFTDPTLFQVLYRNNITVIDWGTIKDILFP